MIIIFRLIFQKKLINFIHLIKKVRKKRIEAGSLELNTPDIDIKLDDAGNVESITTRSSAKESISNG